MISDSFATCFCQNAAESIGISKLDDRVAATLAGDVEFRIHQVIEVSWRTCLHSIALSYLLETPLILDVWTVRINASQEAQKFMRHSKRLTMLPTDINHALEALNVEVCLRRRLVSSSGTLPRPEVEALRARTDASLSRPSPSSLLRPYNLEC